jgi:hypothetical protein
MNQTLAPSTPRKSYEDFLANKRHSSDRMGFKPTFLPSWLFDFQGDLVEWSAWKGRGAIFADCGLGKTPMQLVWARNVVEQSNRPALVVAPLAASAQTVREAEKFGIPCERSIDGKHSGRAGIVVTNYERLHLFSPSEFAGAVCDESSILKNFDGATKAAVTEFLRMLRYRLLCTATAAPNDHIELGTSSEALGEMGYMDMLSVFFKNDEGSIAPLSYATKWRFKAHAELPFWRWICSWARAIRKPSDLGYSDGRFVLPPLTERVTTVPASRPMDGFLFVMPASNLQEQRAERRLTIVPRCEAVAASAEGADKFVAWCHLNAEADLLEKLIPGARQVSGDHSDNEREEIFDAFSRGDLRVLITKPKIGAFGLNWQHCHRMSLFPSHSYEQYYQAVRRCWRFGQVNPVSVDVITTEGESDVLGNLKRKADAADTMFSYMVQEMNAAQSKRAPQINAERRAALPAWLPSEATCSQN